MSDFDFPFPVKTSFQTRDIPASANLQGIPLGQGKCVGVRLYLNSLAFDTQTAAAKAANLRQIYYGDAQQQRRELLGGAYSPIIYCEDLQEVFVRCNGIANEVEVEVFEQV